MNVLVTGASGFIGQHLVFDLSKRKPLKITVIAKQSINIQGVRNVFSKALDKDTDLSSVLHKQDVVIHTAGRSRKTRDNALNPLSQYRLTDVDVTLNLARQAAKAGVKTFIFISSVKVNGEYTKAGRPFKEDDEMLPVDDYGISKAEAEIGLFRIALETGLKVIIIRPPLVYGASVKGNFALLIKLLKIGVPLPVASIRNKRSMIAIENLIDLIITCITHPNAGNQVFFASDGHDLSTPDLLRGMAQAMHVPSRLFAFPPEILAATAKCVRQSSVADRLLGSLQVDISKAKYLLDWAPPISTEEGLRRCFEKSIYSSTSNE